MAPSSEIAGRCSLSHTAFPILALKPYCDLHWDQFFDWISENHKGEVIKCQRGAQQDYRSEPQDFITVHYQGDEYFEISNMYTL